MCYNKNWNLPMNKVCGPIYRVNDPGGVILQDTVAPSWHRLFSYKPMNTKVKVNVIWYIAEGILP